MAMRYVCFETAGAGQVHLVANGKWNRAVESRQLSKLLDMPTRHLLYLAAWLECGRSEVSRLGALSGGYL
jgi:hypothetical protein